MGSQNIGTYNHPYNWFPGQVSIGGFNSREKLTVSGTVSAHKYKGEWAGDTLSGKYISIEGYDIKSAQIPQGYFLKAGAETATWEPLHSITTDFTFYGDVIQYAADRVAYSKSSVFSKSLSATGTNTVNTFSKADLKTGKYVISLSDTGTNRTACEVLVIYNGTDAVGTTYSIVDAQDTSLLSTITVSAGISTIDIVIAVSADCTATVSGVAHY
tara:strand:+ start:246 stop:887 length:642 start_codon:yes stop_codon:yes gene_type:complete